MNYKSLSRRQVYSRRQLDMTVPYIYIFSQYLGFSATADPTEL